MTDIEEAFFSAAALLGLTSPLHVKARKMAGLRASASLKNGVLRVSVSQGYEAAPREAVVGLGLDLLSRLFRRRVPDSEWVRAYRDFLESKATHQLHRTLRQAHGRKRKLYAQGVRYDLNGIAASLVGQYPLLQEVSVPPLGWSQSESFGRLGFYDPDTHEIVVSRALDKKTVPFFVVEYVVFHEMLHAKHEAMHNASRRTVHTRAFKEDEKRYSLFREASEWLERNDLRRQKL